jgi:hypothetical protein
MSNWEMSLDSRITVIKFGVLPERRRAKIPREIGASMVSKTSGDAAGVSSPLKTCVVDVADGGVEKTRTPGVRRRGDPDVGTDTGVSGVWGTSNDPGRSPMGRSLIFEPSWGDPCRRLSDSCRCFQSTRPVFMTSNMAKTLIEKVKSPLPAASDDEFVLNTTLLLFRLFEARFGALR